MNRIERMTGIVLALQTGMRTAQGLADRFEVSRRTILRDIDALSQLHVPVIAIPGRGGGYRLPDDFSMPPVHLTKEEASVMLLALSSLGLSESSPLGTTHYATREKILAVLSNDVRRHAVASLEHLTVVTDTEVIDESLLQGLRNAAAASTWLEIVHRRNETAMARIVLPELVYLADGRWYLQAIDRLRRAKRTFRLSRIEQWRTIEPPVDGERIVAEANLEPEDYGNPSNPHIVAILTRQGIELARENPHLRSHLSGNRLSFHCPTAELPFHAREFLRFGIEITLEAPSELIDLMLQSLARSFEHHGKR
ncbi:MAG: WYL domain-containing protein [Thermomicrobiales bacterium]